MPPFLFACPASLRCSLYTFIYAGRTLEVRPCAYASLPLFWRRCSWQPPFRGHRPPATSGTIHSTRLKKTLERQVYYDHWITLHCGATFDEKKNITLPEGFIASSHTKRAKKVEWEHVVPAENFGQTFAEWREGDPQCIDNRGKAFKGRNCAEKVSREYRYMQSDSTISTPPSARSTPPARTTTIRCFPGSNRTSAPVK